MNEKKRKEKLSYLVNVMEKKKAGGGLGKGS